MLTVKTVDDDFFQNIKTLILNISANGSGNGESHLWKTEADGVCIMEKMLRTEFTKTKKIENTTSN